MLRIKNSLIRFVGWETEEVKTNRVSLSQSAAGLRREKHQEREYGAVYLSRLLALQASLDPRPSQRLSHFTWRWPCLWHCHQGTLSTLDQCLKELVTLGVCQQFTKSCPCLWFSSTTSWCWSLSLFHPVSNTTFRLLRYATVASPLYPQATFIWHF